MAVYIYIYIYKYIYIYRADIGEQGEQRKSKIFAQSNLFQKKAGAVYPPVSG